MGRQWTLHLFLAVAWMWLTNELSWSNAVLGLLIGGGILVLFKRARGERTYMARIIAAARLIFVFLYEQLKSNIYVLRIVLRPRLNIRPALVEIDLSEMSDEEITAVTHMITLTPGTLSIDVSDDRRHLYVHVIHLDDEQAPPTDLIESTRYFERLVMGVTRP